RPPMCEPTKTAAVDSSIGGLVSDLEEDIRTVRDRGEILRLMANGLREERGRDDWTAKGFTQTMGNEPRRFQSAAERAMQLVAAHALLAGAHEIRSLEPLMKLKMTVLENRSF